MDTRAQSPHPLTGGIGRTRRAVPRLVPAPVPRGYAKLVAWGWDTWQESFDVKWRNPSLAEKLDRAKAEADAADDRGKGLVLIDFGGEKLQVLPCGAKGGVRWVIFNDDFMLLIRSPKCQWSVSARYLSAGLWEEGLNALQHRVYEALKAELLQPAGDDWVRVTRSDFALDFWSEEFTGEMRPGILEGVVCHSSCKGGGALGGDDEPVTFVTHGRRLETIYIGSKARCQVTVYDKGREIHEASGKTWLIEIWMRNGYVAPVEGRARDVWRVEVRMGGDWLKQRNVRRPGQVIEERESLIADALYHRRLTVPSETDTNERRWPLHPLWALALHEAGSADMLPLGRYVTGRREVFERRQEKQIAGNFRTVMVSKGLRINDVAAARRLADDAIETMMNDPDGDRKAAVAFERQRFLDEAR